MSVWDRSRDASQEVPLRPHPTKKYGLRTLRAMWSGAMVARDLATFALMRFWTPISSALARAGDVVSQDVSGHRRDDFFDQHRIQLGIHRQRQDALRRLLGVRKGARLV